MVVASRVLKLRRGDRILDVPIRIWAPRETVHGTWSCRYELEWPDGTWSMNAEGADSVQAAFIALQMIGSEIYTSDYHKSGQLFFEAPGSGYGFPVPASLRSLLQGTDAEHL
jgi:hypothetical protein